MYLGNFRIRRTLASCNQYPFKNRPDNSVCRSFGVLVLSASQQPVSAASRGSRAIVSLFQPHGPYLKHSCGPSVTACVLGSDVNWPTSHHDYPGASVCLSSSPTWDRFPRLKAHISRPSEPATTLLRVTAGDHAVGESAEAVNHNCRRTMRNDCAPPGQPGIMESTCLQTNLAACHCGMWI